jgi:hypothetical protein
MLAPDRSAFALARSHVHPEHDHASPMRIVALSPAAVAHAARRYHAYGNSHAAIARRFRNRGELARERLCIQVRQLELELGLDLGRLCARFESRLEPGVSAFERAVLESLAVWTEPRDGSAPALVVHVDRVYALNALAEAGQLAAREQALALARALERGADPS